MRNARDLGVGGHLQYRHGVHERNNDPAVFFLANQDIAWQQQADIRFRGQRAVGKRRIAGAENSIGPPFDPQLGLHGRLHIDIRQDSEALDLEGLGHVDDGL